MILLEATAVQKECVDIIDTGGVNFLACPSRHPYQLESIDPCDPVYAYLSTSDTYTPIFPFLVHISLWKNTQGTVPSVYLEQRLLFFHMWLYKSIHLQSEASGVSGMFKLCWCLGTYLGVQNITCKTKIHILSRYYILHIII